jgi:hypothetical protein
VGIRPQEHATCPFHNGSVDESGSLKVHSLLRMAPNLAESQHAQIRDMVLSNRPPAEIADAVGCSFQCHRICCSLALKGIQYFLLGINALGVANPLVGGVPTRQTLALPVPVG